MKEIWTLSIKTSLPNLCKTPADLKLSIYVYESFERAKRAFYEKMKEIAFKENCLFDGNGKIKELNYYTQVSYESEDEEEDESIGILTVKALNDFQNKLSLSLKGETTKLNLCNGKYCDSMLSLVLSNDSVTVFGDEEGPINGCDAFIHTNILDMSEEKDYFLYIDDLFSFDQDASCELYIDLKKATLEK